MKVAYKCHNCETASDFDTDAAPQLLLEAFDPEASDRQTYVVTCKKCGAENRVSVEGADRGK